MKPRYRLFEIPEVRVEEYIRMIQAAIPTAVGEKKKSLERELVSITLQLNMERKRRKKQN